MKILLINKFYHTAARSGGVGRYLFELQNLLIQRGHQVIPFAIHDKDAVASPYLRYFPAAEDYRQVKFGLRKLKSAVKYLRNGEAARKLEQLIKVERPDVAHIHNIYHHLTPAIFKPLRKYKIPVVMTVHDYKLVCPNQALFTNGQRCQRCWKHRYYNCVRYRCVKNSCLASILASTEAYLNWFMQSYQQNVAKFVVPSQFMAGILTRFGFEQNKIAVLPYALDTASYRPNYHGGNYFLYAGRLSSEKGIDDLLQAASKIYQNFHLKIVGGGPSEADLKKLTHQLGLDGKVEFTGFKDKEGLVEIVRRSSFAVAPSRWYDNAPLAIAEAMLLGKPVIGPAHGGVPEMIRDGENGLLYQSDDITGLTAKITHYLKNPELAQIQGQTARKIIERRVNPARHIDQLEALYHKVRTDY